MRPLSVRTYYINNLNKVVPLSLLILLSVVLLYILQMVIDSALIINYRAYVEPHKYYVSVTAKSKVLEQSLIDKLQSLDTVEMTIPWVFHYTNFDSMIGSSIGTKVITAKGDHIAILMDRLRLELVAGRWPEPGTNEIILHRLVAANKGLAIGDRFGSDIDRAEVIQGSRTVVGVVDGDSIVSFDSLEYWMRQNNVTEDDYSLGMIILPKAGQATRLEQHLNTLHAPGLEVRTFNSVSSQNMQDEGSVHLILTMIDMMLFIIVSVCCAFINYIHFYQRRTEYGILSALGYTKQAIVDRLFAEIVGVQFGSLVVGVLLSLFIGLLLNIAVFIPNGEPLLLFRIDTVTKVACIPLFATALSLIPVWRMIKHLDPLAIIEGAT